MPPLNNYVLSHLLGFELKIDYGFSGRFNRRPTFYVILFEASCRPLIFFMFLSTGPESEVLEIAN